MKAKVKLTDNYSGRSLNIITNLTNIESNKYDFSFESLSDSQRAKIEKFFGKLNAYYTKHEVLKTYKD